MTVEKPSLTASSIKGLLRCCTEEGGEEKTSGLEVDS